jgi:uncharacterized protein (DUF2062 family)
MKDWLYRKVVRPVLGWLGQGITPRKLALAIAIGAIIGVFPLIGATTLISAAAAVLLRLNMPAVQLANYLVYPLQFLLLIPFYQLGAWLFGAEPVTIAVEALMKMFATDFWASLGQFWQLTLHAIAAWGLVAVPAGALLYGMLKPVLSRIDAARRTSGYAGGAPPPSPPQGGGD